MAASSTLGVLKVIANLAAGRIAPRLVVRRLVGALGSDDEDTSMAAYMALVKLGPRVGGLLVDEARKGNQTAGVLQVLGDLGDPTFISDLAGFESSTDPAVVKAARESISALRGRHEDLD